MKVSTTVDGTAPKMEYYEVETTVEKQGGMKVDVWVVLMVFSTAFVVVEQTAEQKVVLLVAAMVLKKESLSADQLGMMQVAMQGGQWVDSKATLLVGEMAAQKDDDQAEMMAPSMALTRHSRWLF